jgi:signal peptidase II
MKKWPWLLITLGVIFADQFTKIWALRDLVPYQSKVIFPMLNFTLAFNTGAAFSFLHSSGVWHHWFFMAFSLGMSVVLFIWLLMLDASERLQLFSLCLILAGALGNVIDRFKLGHVVDFIDVYYGQHHWPVFNVADSAICVGAVLLFIELTHRQRST